MTTLTEGELVFTFPSSWAAERFDVPGKALPKHTAPVDFVVETPDRILFVEVKDPSNTKAPSQNQQAFVKKMFSDELTHQELVPKARTSWSYLHLMARITKPVSYVVAIGSEQLSVQPLLFSALTEKLRRRLEHEADVPWVTTYVESCIVVPALDLGRYLAGVNVVRVGGGP